MTMHDGNSTGGRRKNDARVLMAKMMVMPSGHWRLSRPAAQGGSEPAALLQPGQGQGRTARRRRALMKAGGLASAWTGTGRS
eukprot:COSAG01_NODE_11446_length_1931_cov_0.859170_2_plen_82_part_00